MLCTAAKKLNIKTTIYCDDIDAPAQNFCDEFVFGEYDNKKKILDFISKVNVVTYEFENIPYETLNEINKLIPVLPKPSVNRLIQHRIAEKDFINKLNIRTTRYVAIEKKSDMDTLEDFLPGILKTTTLGYDGKGQYPIKKIEDIKPQETPSIESIEAGLWMQMNNYEENLKTSGSRLKDEKLDKYLKDILCKLTPDYCKDIRVYVQDIPLFNAFMAPNGMMVVWTGLLLRAQNEAQLAAVIGHEAGHYIRRHSLKSWLDAKARADLMAILSVGLAVGGVPGGGNIFNLTQLLQVGIIAKHSRDNEREADKIGLDFLINSGYDTYELSLIHI